VCWPSRPSQRTPIRRCRLVVGGWVGEKDGGRKGGRWWEESVHHDSVGVVVAVFTMLRSLIAPPPHPPPRSLLVSAVCSQILPLENSAEAQIARLFGAKVCDTPCTSNCNLHWTNEGASVTRRVPHQVLQLTPRPPLRLRRPPRLLRRIRMQLQSMPTRPSKRSQSGTHQSSLRLRVTRLVALIRLRLFHGPRPSPSPSPSRTALGVSQFHGTYSPTTVPLLPTHRPPATYLLMGFRWPR
jgi:hypothetical protein